MTDPTPKPDQHPPLNQPTHQAPSSPIPEPAPHATTPPNPAPSSPSPQDAAAGSSPPPTSLPPLFPMINNITTGTTHHPQVHYVFSDDDPEILTEALARSQAAGPQSPDVDSLPGNARIPVSRSMLLDLAPTPDGRWEVACASSLSPDWAIVDAHFSRVEDNGRPRETRPGDDTDPEVEAALILKVDGIEADGVASLPLPTESDMPSSSSGSGAQVAPREDYGALIDEFDRRMVQMRKVHAAGETHRRKFAEQASREQQQDAGAEEQGDAENPPTEEPAVGSTS